MIYNGILKSLFIEHHYHYIYHNKCGRIKRKKHEYATIKSSIFAIEGVIIIKSRRKGGD